MSSSNDDTQRYLDMVKAFPLRPIRSDAQANQAFLVVQMLKDRTDLGPGERDYIEVLEDLIEKCESLPGSLRDRGQGE
jgi:HTH-type transcriptional regulator / antitoxin HigA